MIMRYFGFAAEDFDEVYEVWVLQFVHNTYLELDLF